MYSVSKTGQDSDAVVFLVVLGVIGIALPACLCAGVFLMFGVSTVRTVGPATVATPTTWAQPTTSPAPSNGPGSFATPTTQPPSGIEVE